MVLDSVIGVAGVGRRITFTATFSGHDGEYKVMVSWEYC